jgi:hypothetical protein
MIKITIPTVIELPYGEALEQMYVEFKRRQRLAQSATYRPPGVTDDPVGVWLTYVTDDPRKPRREVTVRPATETETIFMECYANMKSYFVFTEPKKLR